MAGTGQVGALTLLAHGLFATHCRLIARLSCGTVALPPEKASTMQDLIKDIEDATQTLPGHITPDTPLATISGWDSLGLVDLFSAIDERYGLDISTDDIQGCTTVSDLHALLMERVALRGATA